MLTVKNMPSISAGVAAKRAKTDDARSMDRIALGQFRIIFRSVRKHFQDVEKRCGISGSQLWALAAIGNEPGIRVTELAARLSIHQSTASNLIEVLVRKDLVEKKRGSEDQRTVRLFCTRAGAKVLSRAPEPFDGLLPDALRNLRAAELQQLTHSLELVVTAMRRRDESARLRPLADA